MIQFYLKIEKLWFDLVEEKIRFVLVGGFNTCLSYILFLLFEHWIGYKIGVLITYAIAINVSIFTMRYYVFRATGYILKQYIKAASVYAFMIIANYIFLAVTIDWLGLKAWLAQALFTFISTITTYFLHKKVSFRSF